MANQADYQALLETVVTAAAKAAEKAKQAGDGALLFAYYDVLDVIKTQADIMDVPIDDIGLSSDILDRLLQATIEIERQKQAA